MIISVVLCLAGCVLVRHFTRKIDEVEEQELTEFYRTCAMTDKIMDEYYDTLGETKNE